MTYRITYFLRSGEYHSQQIIQATDYAEAQLRANEYICAMRPQVNLERFEVEEQ